MLELLGECLLLHVVFRDREFLVRRLCAVGCVRSGCAWTQDS